MRNSLESDYDNNGGETVSLIVVVNLKLITNIVIFTKPLESIQYCEFAKCTSMHEYLDGCRASSIECQ